MQPKAVERKEIAQILQQWVNELVRVYVFSHGVGMNHWGYLDLACEARGGGVIAGSTLLPDLVLLCRTKRPKGSPRSEAPLVLINLNDFVLFNIDETESSRSVSCKNENTGTRVVIEGGLHAAA